VIVARRSPVGGAPPGGRADAHRSATAQRYRRVVELPSPLPPELAELIAQRFRVIGDQTRIRLLDRLRRGSATVGELTDEIGGSQQNVSKHLGVLHQAGILSRTKEGTAVRYAIADESVFALCEQVCGGLRERVSELDALLAQAS